MEIPDSPSSKVLPWIIPALYAAITVHELGHLVAGKFAGMEAGGLVIGGIVILKSGERWVLRFDRWFIFGGLAKPLPLKGTFRPARFAWMVAGGPIASFLLLVSREFSILRLGDGAGIGPVLCSGRRYSRFLPR